MERKRYHVLTILYDIWNLIKNSFVIALFLFVINRGSESFIWKYGRYAFYVFIALSLIHILLKWWTRKYKLGDSAFYLYEGVFQKREQTIPFEKIQNINRQGTLFHKLSNMTALHLETAMTGENASVAFEVLSKRDADDIDAHIKTQLKTIPNVEEPLNQDFNPVEGSQDIIEKIVHFTPERWDLVKASFTSLSFLILIPIMLTVYNYIDDIFEIDERAEGVIGELSTSWWIVAMVILLLLILSITFGMIRIFVKYGKYEIASDIDRIYIKQGTLNEFDFSISKNRVQAIEMEQTFLKRIFGLVEVKLISSGNTEVGEEEVKANSLYPFLPKEQAHQLVTELLPDYEMSDSWSSLPKRALPFRMLKASWFFILVALGLGYFKPPIFNINQAWWILILLLFLFMVTTIYLNYKHTKFSFHHHFIQLKKGSFSITQLITKREKIVEVKVSKSILQKRFGLATLEIVNRESSDVRHSDLVDIPIESASTFYHWYMERVNEIKIN